MKILSEKSKISAPIQPKIIAQGAEATIELVTPSPTTPSEKVSPRQSSPTLTESSPPQELVTPSTISKSSLQKKASPSQSSSTLTESSPPSNHSPPNQDSSTPTTSAFILKKRIPKSYRLPEIDSKIRTRRTRSEIKLLTKASQVINVPLPLTKPDTSETIIKMPFINGKKLSQELNNFTLEKQKEILKQIGKDVAKLHKENIIHGDLTTSNMILVEEPEINDKNPQLTKAHDNENSQLNKIPAKDCGKAQSKANQVYFIDFGIGFQNGKYEDKAVDIHLLKQALEAKHFQKWQELFKEFEQGYLSINREESKKVLERLKTVEKRGRYKH